jgi:threonylcarbamoyladenosine tRNA methylthiotransferase MtaB
MQLCRSHNARAFVKIQDGCNSFCTYCYVPLVRGRVRSRSAEEIFSEVERLRENGYGEVVLTGIETGAWGTDFSEPANLCDLVEELAKRSGIERIRFGSLKPSLFTDDFCKRLSSVHGVLPHFHLSLQSGSSRVLALMKRKYNAEQAMACIERLREAMPGVKLTTDVIVGFPGETEEDFLESCEFARRAGFLMIHVFPYSIRKGTVAAEMKNQVPEHIKHERVRILNEISREIRARILDETVKNENVAEVLFETHRAGYASGHTADFVEVRVRTDKKLNGLIRAVKLTGHDGDVCEGVLL